ncbi:MAG: SufS family cysteine desulfurase [Acidimicrobiales bacterium]|nr:SufS family cysteine desulfurase [Acidimicrobiales bacterium]
MSLDVQAIKADFPLLQRQIDGERLIYLDSANTSQKPAAVIEAVDRYYRTHNANVHRGSYQLAVEATADLEGARAKVARFIGAPHAHEVIFTKNATEAINLVAQSWGRANLSAGDVVVISDMEHHANIVPWHMLVDELGIELRWIPIDEQGQLDLTDLDRLLDGAAMLSITAMSNVLGTINPLDRLITAARAAGAAVMLDASQHVPHMPINVGRLGADFVAFTGHKMLGPMGIGVLWGRTDLLEAMPPWIGGGEMILNVTKTGFTTTELPWKFEAGTPMVGDAVGLGAAVDYLEAVGLEAIRNHEVALTSYAMRLLTDRLGDQLHLFGPSEPAQRGGVLSFTLGDAHPHDIAQVLDQHNVCVRAGHHCAKPLMQVLGVGATTRVSLYLYNDESDIDALAGGLEEASAMFAL